MCVFELLNRKEKGWNEGSKGIFMSFCESRHIIFSHFLGLTFCAMKKVDMTPFFGVASTFNKLILCVWSLVLL